VRIELVDKNGTVMRSVDDIPDAAGAESVLPFYPVPSRGERSIRQSPPRTTLHGRRRNDCGVQCSGRSPLCF